MSVPGWYPDPRGGPGLRFWDGARWTDHTAAWEMQGESPTSGPPHDRSNLGLWIALAVSVALIIGLGTWLLFFRDGTTSTTPDTTPAASPSPSPSEPAVTEGDVLAPLDCVGNAVDATGEPNAGGRYESAAGLSFPAVPGFQPNDVQYPWVHGSNSQVKYYDNQWMASVTVGHLEESEGFAGHEAAAVRFARCLIGSVFYGDALSQATVLAIESQPQNEVTWLDVDIDVTGIEDVTQDWLTVVTAERDGVLHIAVAVVPDSAESDYDLVDAALQDLSFA
ncbi:DUF2510 domain-containing protein [Tessaracoccus sp. OS52]|uniref:DUF2510 domain-containing protein n=1 Tax=Tessaracoccus sp. OS52 TaxID=2886691 RepID=UPI001D0FE92C|nr:DUF2510 domain-containing protein [Tessaracoccus sp. OS52]MCC2593481.1 DUF2510 domain-containing protein [Tessaracoccus sp. OS52]